MHSNPKNFAAPSPALDQQSLRADCRNCFALCCTALGFTRSADFAIDKPAETPCTNLASDFSCTIHDKLRPRGFRGCTVFDCFGAGQNVSQNLFEGTSWKTNPEIKQDMFAAFKITRQLHEMLWYLAEASRRTYDPEIKHETLTLRAGIEHSMNGDLSTLLGLDVNGLHAQVRSLLMKVSEGVRASYFASGTDHLETTLKPGVDLMGEDLRSRSLCGADLRGAYLIAADLRSCDLSGADLLGVDLRDARVDDTDLSEALFLTQPQINAAVGNSATQLPPNVTRPRHWEEE